MSPYPHRQERYTLVTDVELENQLLKSLKFFSDSGSEMILKRVVAHDARKLNVAPHLLNAKVTALLPNERRKELGIRIGGRKAASNDTGAD